MTGWYQSRASTKIISITVALRLCVLGRERIVGCWMMASMTYVVSYIRSVVYCGSNIRSVVDCGVVLRYMYL